MKKKFFLYLVSYFTTSCMILAQEDPTFTIITSTDSVLLGNAIKITFTLNQVNGKNFTPPDWKDWEVQSGPSTMMSTSIINGSMSGTQSFTYYCAPKEIGEAWIGPASIDYEGKTLESNPLKVRVYPNPDGIKSSPESDDEMMQPFFSRPKRIAPPQENPAPKEPKASGRKLYKI